MSRSGYVQCFLFEHQPVRGCVARLDPVWQDIQQKRDDPPMVRQLLGEMLAACALLSAHLKFDGKLGLQLMGDGPVRLLVAEYQSDGTLRATARYDDDLPETGNLVSWVGSQARFAVVIDTGQGTPWQGVVPVAPQGIAHSLRQYFEQSEQLETHILLHAEGAHCSGFLLQKMPSGQQDDGWKELFLLAETLKPDELQHWDEMELLRKLFAEQDVRLFDAQPRRHACQCSRDGVGRMIRGLGLQEARHTLDEQGEIRVTCEFCAAAYVFDRVDINALFREDTHPAPSCKQ